MGRVHINNDSLGQKKTKKKTQNKTKQNKTNKTKTKQIVCCKIQQWPKNIYGAASAKYIKPLMTVHFLALDNCWQQFFLVSSGTQDD